MYWEAVVGDLKEGETADDYISFEDAESLETIVTLKKASSQITIQPVCPEKLVVSFNNSDSTIIYPCDTTIQLSFNKPVAAGCQNNINIRIPDIPQDKTGLDYFKSPVVEEEKITFFAKAIDGDYSNRIPVTASGKIIAVILNASDFYYVNTEYSKPVKVFLQEDKLFSYTISQETSEKTETKYTLDNNATAAGNYRVDDVDLGGKSEKYSVGTTINLKYQLIEFQDYKFAGWNFAYAEPNSTNYVPVAQNELESLNIGISYPEHADTFGYDPITHTAQALVTVYNYKGGLIYVSPNVVPVPKTEIWIDGSNGKLSPGKGKHTVREGEENSISFEADGDYDFICWKVYNEDTLLTDYSQYIQIAQTSQAETTFKLLSIPDDEDFKLTIKPEVTERPQVISATPIYDALGAYRDARVQVVFDHPMDINCIYYTTDEVGAIEADFNPDNPEDKMLAVDEEDPDTKYYGYVKDGNYVFKNIQIKNNKTQQNLLSCYNAPEFDEDLKVLVIPAKKGDAAPAGGLTILVEIGKNFSFKEETTDKPINMREAKKWIYFVNSKTDINAPEVSSLKILDSQNKEIKQDTAVNYLTKEQKLKFQIEAVDNGSGPAGYFEMVFQNNAHSAIQIPFERVEGASASCGDTTNGKNDFYTFDLSQENLSDGTYTFSLKFYDQNLNDGVYKSSSNSSGQYTITVDTTPPAFTKKELAAALNSTDPAKTDITLTCKLDAADFKEGKLYYREVVSKQNRTAWEDWTGVTNSVTLEKTADEQTVTVPALTNSKTYELKAVLCDEAGNVSSYLFKKNTIPATDPSAIKYEVDNVVNTISITPNGSDADANSYEIIKMEDLRDADTVRSTWSSATDLGLIKKGKTWIIKNKVSDTRRYNLYVKGTNYEAISDIDYANNGCSYENANPNETVLQNILTKPKGFSPFESASPSTLKYDYDTNSFVFNLVGYTSANKYGVKISYAPYNSDGTLGDYSSGKFTDDCGDWPEISIPYTDLDSDKLYNFKVESYFYSRDNLCVEGKARYIDAVKNPPVDVASDVKATLNGETILLSWTPKGNEDIDYYFVRAEQWDGHNDRTLSTVRIDKNQSSCLLAIPNEAEEESTSSFLVVDSVKDNKFYEPEKYSDPGCDTYYTGVDVPAHNLTAPPEPEPVLPYINVTNIAQTSLMIQFGNLPQGTSYIARSTDYNDLKDPTKRTNATYESKSSNNYQNVSGLTQGTLYYFAFTDRNSGDINLCSEIFIARTKSWSDSNNYFVTQFSAVVDENDSGKVTLTWKPPREVEYASSNIGSMKIGYLQPEVSPDWQIGLTLSSKNSMQDTTSYEINGLTPGSFYIFKVSGFNDNNTEFPSYIPMTIPEPVIIIPDPDPVKGINFTANFSALDNNAALSWEVQDNSIGFDYYRIYNDQGVCLVDNIPKTTNALTLICIQKAMNIYIAGCKDYKPVIVSDPVAVSSSAIPYFNIIVRCGAESVYLNFEDNWDFEANVRNSGFIYYYKKSSDSTWTGPDQLANDGQIKGLQAATKYDFKVITKGNSDYTDSVPAIVSQYTMANTVTYNPDDISVSSDSITVNWTNPQGPYYKTVFQYRKSDSSLTNDDSDWTSVLTIFSDDVEKEDSYTFNNLKPLQGYKFRWKTFVTPETNEYFAAIKTSEVFTTPAQ